VRSGVRSVVGIGLGFVGGCLLPFPMFAALGLATAGAVLGRVVTPVRFVCSEPECGAVMAGELPTCPGCGGTIAETIANAHDRLERREALEDR
jgi:hypothetical protein